MHNHVLGPAQNQNRQVKAVTVEQRKKMTTETKLETKIIEDLRKSGYLSEMLALRAFSKRKWDASGNVIYFDDDEKKSREGDLHAEHRIFHKISDEKEIECAYHIVAEVKKSENPWVIFKEGLGHGNDTEVRSSFPDQWGNLVAYKNLPGERPDYNPLLQKYSIAHRCGWVGVGVHESFKPPQDKSRWYQAAVSANKVALHIYSNFTCPCDNNHVQDIISNPTYFKMYRPVIILDGPLYASELDKSGQPVIEECQAACLVFEYSSREYEMINDIDIVTLKYLDEYIDICERRIRNILNGILKFGGVVQRRNRHKVPDSKKR